MTDWQDPNEILDTETIYLRLRVSDFSVCLIGFSPVCHSKTLNGGT